MSPEDGGKPNEGFFTLIDAVHITAGPQNAAGFEGQAVRLTGKVFRIKTGAGPIATSVAIQWTKIEGEGI